jgi:hypothetical protein
MPKVRRVTQESLPRLPRKPKKALKPKDRGPVPITRTTAGTVLCLDVSSVCVGYAVFENTTLRAYGKHLQEGRDHGERLTTFRAWLFDQLNEVQPDHLVVELPFAGRRRFAYGVLQMYWGMVQAVYYEWAGHELPVEDRVQANVVKQRMGSKHKATHDQRKKAMVDQINGLYGLSLKFKSGATDKQKRVSDDDISDAIALGRAWLGAPEND